MELLKLLSASELAAQLISFVLLLLCLRFLLWRPLLQLLDDRKNHISQEFKKIEDTQRTLANLKSDYEVKLSSIEDAARIKIQEAIEAGRRQAQEITLQAQASAREIIDNAQIEIKHELLKAKEELKDKVIDLTIAATEHIVEEKLTAEGDKKLIAEFLDKIEQA